MNDRGMFLLLLCLAGCGDFSHDRALRDEEVGGARVGDASFTVVDGLGTFHASEPGKLRLWLSAPVVDLVATVAERGTWELELYNAMPDGQLVVRQSDGAPAIDSLAETIATHKHFVVTLPAGNSRLRFGPADADERTPWRMAVMSDIQTGVDRVSDMFVAINQQHDIRFLLGAGDLSQNGTAAELERVQRELEILDVPYYTTLGNHDAEPDTPWQALYGRGNFSFRYRGVRFSLLDSASASIDPLAYDWLDDWLEDGVDGVHVFAMHIPALDPVGTRNGAFGSRNEAGKLMARLAEGQVDLTLYGHIHSFYQYENAGIPAFISGGGGAHPEIWDGVGRHFLVVELGADSGVLRTDLVEVD